MTFTDEQLWAAVRSAGRDGKAFTCADLRDALGMSTNKRQELSKFRDRFRAFRLASGALIEKVGKTEYRIREASEAPRVAARAKKAVAAEAVAAPAPAEIETVAAPEPTPVETETVIAPEPAPVEIAIAAAAAPAEIETVVAPELLAALEALEPPAVDAVVVPEPVVVEMLAPQKLEVAAVVAAEPASAPCESAMQAAAADAALAAELSEELIEAEVRSLVSVPEISTGAAAVQALIAQAEQPVIRTWRDRGQWLSRRFAGLFARG